MVLYRICEPEDAIAYAFDCIDNAELLPVNNELPHVWDERFSHLQQTLKQAIPRIHTRTQSMINLKLALFYGTSPMSISIPVSDNVQEDLVKSILRFSSKVVITEEEMTVKLTMRRYQYPN